MHRFIDTNTCQVVLVSKNSLLPVTQESREVEETSELDADEPIQMYDDKFCHNQIAVASFTICRGFAREESNPPPKSRYEHDPPNKIN